MITSLPTFLALPPMVQSHWLSFSYSNVCNLSCKMLMQAGRARGPRGGPAGRAKRLLGSMQDRTQTRARRK